MSRHRHDDLSKLSLQLWLAPLGHVSLDARITGEARRGDVLFVEKPRSNPGHRSRLGLLGQLARGTVLFEPYRNPPTLPELSSCLVKRAELWAHALRAARRKKRPPERVKPPLVIVVTPSFSPERKRACGISRRQRGGVYQLAEVAGCVLVVANELPAGRETLWLRLMGREEVQRRAIAEVLRQLKKEPLADATLKLIALWRESLPPEEEQLEEEKEQMLNWERSYARWEKRVKTEGFVEGLAKGEARGEARGEAKGKAEGKAEGLAEGEARGLAEGKAAAVVAVLEGRGLKVTAAQRKRILACRDLARLDRWLLKALSATATAALLPARKPAARATKTSPARERGR